jgi:hypothetical protein
MSRPKKANKMHTSLRPNIQRFAREEARDARDDAEYVKEGNAANAMQSCKFIVLKQCL